MPTEPIPEQKAARYNRGTFLTSFSTADATCEEEIVGFSFSVLSEVKVLGKIITVLIVSKMTDVLAD